MQTFLPHEFFLDCAQVLDNKRLNKQIVECQQILNCLYNPEKKGWSNHPAVKMWEDHKPALICYMGVMHFEWTRRRGSERCHGSWQKIVDTYYKTHMQDFVGTITYPEWLGNPELHASHRANLLRKDPVHYGQFGWQEDQQEGYWWPTKELV